MLWMVYVYLLIISTNCFIDLPIGALISGYSWSYILFVYNWNNRLLHGFQLATQGDLELCVVVQYAHLAMLHLESRIVLRWFPNTNHIELTCFILRNTPRQGFMAILQQKLPLDGSSNVSNIERLNRMLPTADWVALMVRICNPWTSASINSSLPTLERDWMAFAMTSEIIKLLNYNFHCSKK